MGFDTNPMDDQPIDKEEYEKWEKSQQESKIQQIPPKGIVTLSPPYPARHPIPEDVILDPSEECPF